MDQEEPVSPSSLKQKLKFSFSLTPSCFVHREPNQPHETLASATKPKILRTSSNTLEKTTRPHHHHPHELKDKTTRPHHHELRDKCRHFISHIGGGSGGGTRHGRRHSSSADFRYDPMSYALNFDEGCDDRDSNEYPSRSFCSRLPPSPTKEINAI